MTLNEISTSGVACPLCGRGNECQLCVASAYKGPCWCAKIEIPDGLLAQIPREFQNRVCVCQNCIETFRPSLRLKE